MILKIKNNLKILFTTIVCSILHVKNLVFTKKLVIKSFLYTNKLINRGNISELSWDITGCYKISIKDLGVIAGNTNQVSIKLYKKINTIEITFYGIGGQKEIKNIEIKTNSPIVLNSFTPDVNISNIASIPLLKEDLIKVKFNLFSYKEPKRINLQNPKIAYQNLKINFDRFIKSNYSIKS